VVEKGNVLYTLCGGINHRTDTVMWLAKFRESMIHAKYGAVIG